MNLIVAVDEKWGIGCGGELLCSIPGDLRFFKEKTIDKVVVMGRKTLESLPGKRGLPRRVNIVLTGNPAYSAERCTTVTSEEALLDLLSEYDPEDVYIIGGESIYRRFYRQCDKCYVTKMYADLGADRFMPDLDREEDFEITWSSDPQEENGVRYQWFLYEKVR